MYKIATKNAAGLMLAHDITRIIPGQKQFPVLSRGHIIQPEDITMLLELGKDEVYIGNPSPGEVHEEEAALRIAAKACGSGLTWENPSQGRLNITAQEPGLLKIDVNRLQQINRQNGFVLATLHNNRAVQKGEIVAGTRIVPLTVSEEELFLIEGICSSAPVIKILPFKPLKAGIISTGNEIYQGKFADASYDTIQKKLSPFLETSIHKHVLVPDNPELIAENINSMINMEIDLIIVTGGMSVDSNDMTPTGIALSGADIVQYGIPILPASQFLLAYHGNTPVCGLPGGSLVSKITVFDILLPRFIAGDQILKEELIALGHGGLCSECHTCHYPICPFGKN